MTPPSLNSPPPLHSTTPTHELDAAPGQLGEFGQKLLFLFAVVVLPDGILAAVTVDLVDGVDIEFYLHHFLHNHLLLGLFLGTQLITAKSEVHGFLFATTVVHAGRLRGVFGVLIPGQLAHRRRRFYLVFLYLDIEPFLLGRLVRPLAGRSLDIQCKLSFFRFA